MASYNLDYSRARADCACSWCGWWLFGHFYSHLSFLSSFSLFLGDGPILTEILSQRAVKPKINQPTPKYSFILSTQNTVSFFQPKIQSHLKIQFHSFNPKYSFILSTHSFTPNYSFILSPQTTVSFFHPKLQ